MTRLDIMQLAAKDSLVLQHGHFLLSWPRDQWAEAVGNRIAAFFDLTQDSQDEILAVYLGVNHENTI